MSIRRKAQKSGAGLGDGELLTPQKDIVKISAAGEEGRLEETQEEVLPHDAKCDNANNLTKVSKIVIFQDLLSEFKDSDIFVAFLKQ